MTDNFMDIAHFPWVHLGTFGVEQHTDVPTLHLEALDDSSFGYRSGSRPAMTPAAPWHPARRATYVARRISAGFHLPFSVRSTIPLDAGFDHVLLLCSTVDDTTSSFTFVVWRNDDFSTPSEEIIAFDRAIGAEDKVMLDGVPGVLSLDRRRRWCTWDGPRSGVASPARR